MTKKYFLIICLSFFCFLSLKSQIDLPLGGCPAFRVGSVFNAKLGDTIAVPVFMDAGVEAVAGFYHSIYFDPEFLTFVDLQETQRSFDIFYPGEEFVNTVMVESIPKLSETPYSISPFEPFYTLYFEVIKEIEDRLELQFSIPGIPKYLLDLNGNRYTMPGISGYVWPSASTSSLRINEFCVTTLPEDCSGEKLVTIDMEGGTLPYKYNWATGGNMVPFDSLSNTFKLTEANLYMLTVTDANGDSVSASYTLEVIEPVEINYSSAITQPDSCYQFGKVEIELQGEFDFVWSDTVNQLSRNDLRPGSYYVAFENKTCDLVDTLFIEIEAVDAPALKAEVKSPSCQQSNGFIILDFEEEIDPISYKWSNGLEGNKPVQEDLPPGNYEVEVNWESCRETYFFSLVDSNILDIDMEATINDAPCGRNGSIALLIQEDTSKLDVIWSNGQQGTELQNLNSGIYQITITNNENGCFAVKNYEVKSRSLDVQFEEDCVIENGNLVSSITASTEDGPFPVSFKWTSKDGEKEIFQFAEGPIAISTVNLIAEELYDLEVTNANSCSQTFQDVNLKCLESLDGSIFITLETPLLSELNTLILPITLSSPSFLKSLQMQINWENPQLSLSEVRFGNALRFPEAFSYFSNSTQSINLDWDSKIGSEVISTNTLCYLVFDIAGTIDEPFNFSFSPGQTSVLNLVNNSLEIIEKVNSELSGDAKTYDVENQLTFSFPTIQAFPDIPIEVPLTVKNYNDLLGFSATFTWPTDLLTFIEISETHPALEQNLNNNINLDAAINSGKLAIIAASSKVVNIDDNETLFKIKFRTKTKEGIAFLGLSNDFLVVEAFTETGFQNGNAVFPLFKPGSVQILDLNVWPGDVDRNGIVNSEDWLYFGLAKDFSGPNRTDVTGSWKSTPSLNWNSTFPFSKLNHKNADINGDGFIDLADTSLIHDNYSLNTTEYPFTFQKPVLFRPEPLSLQFDIQVDSFMAEQSVQIPIKLENHDLVKNLIGYAFTFEVDTTWVKPNSLKFTPSDGFFGLDNEIYSLAKQIDEQHFEVAIFAENELGTLSNDILGQLEFELFAQPKNFEIDSIFLHLENIIIMDAEEGRYSTQGEITNIPVRYMISSSEEQHLAQYLKIYPVPAGDIINLDFSIGKIERIEVLNLQGQVIRTEQGFDLESTGLQTLNNGLYIFSIFTNKGKLNKLVPIYR